MTATTVPEEAVVHSVLSDPLGAATLLTAFANRGTARIRAGTLVDIARRENLPTPRIQPLLAALLDTGLIAANEDGYLLSITIEDAMRYAAVLRGAAYALHRHQDANTVELTLSPPAHPSRLMEILPTHGFSWTRLYNTRDSLIELASSAQKRFVIVSPFVDADGLEWIGQLFAASSRKPIERILIVRGRDEKEIEALKSFRMQLAGHCTKILTYAISHDPVLRTPTIETFHAKLLLADTDRAYIGSANMTRWSRDISLECGVVIRGPAAKPVATLIDAIISVAQPWPIGSQS